MVFLNIEDFIKSGEGQTIEFKEVVTPSQVLARIISAFSNTEGGTILFGIREPDIITGIDSEKFKRMYQQASLQITGLAKTSTKIINYQDKKIGVIQVDKSSSPVGTTQGYFVRIGETDRPLSSEQLKELFTKKGDHDKAIESLSQTVTKQTEEIGKLRESFEQANSWKRKFFYAFLGALATGVAKLLLILLGISIG